jgi:4-carboxymuconolactone decarboxylase
VKDPNFDKGMEIRKAVLGAEYVETSLRNADAFSLPLQELITSYCCGAVWGRDGLPHTMRSLLNVAMLTALDEENAANPAT